MNLFPFSEYWWFYLAFTAFVCGLLALDLGVFHRKAHAVSFREATGWSAVWIALALAFNYGLFLYARYQFQHSARLTAIAGFDAQSAARQTGLEFLTGYLVEKSLSLDNIFVFVVVFTYFGIPAIYQHRVLFFGIVGALVFRAIFIAIGAALVKYHWMLIVFGVFLIATGVRMAFASDEQVHPERNPLIKLLRRFVPVSGELHGQKFFVRVAGAIHATPLMLTLLVVEASDILFAVDSVPAIFAITDEPLIVFTSNVFAILGLRSLYFLLAGAVQKFWLLKYGLAAVLVFVGLKMTWLNHAFGGKFPTMWSLVIIAAALAASIGASLAIPKRQG